MMYKKLIPRVVLCYTAESDWLARAIADGLEEKDFQISVKGLCIRDTDNLTQKLDEHINGTDYLLFVLNTLSVEKFKKYGVDNELLISISKRCQLVLAMHGILKDNYPANSLDQLPPETKIWYFRITEVFDVSSFAKQIQKNSEPTKICTRPRPDSEFTGFLPVSAIEKDARLIVSNLLLRPDFQFKIDKIAKTCDWTDQRAELAINWSEERGLVRKEDGNLVGISPSIVCFKNITFRQDVRNNNINLTCHFTSTDSLLLCQEEFSGQLFNNTGSLDIKLTASADRSGKIKIVTEPLDSIEKEQQLWLVKSNGLIKLNCTSDKNKNRKLIAKNVKVSYKIIERPIPIQLEMEKLLFTDKKGKEGTFTEDTTRITLCLLEFDCLQLDSNFPCELGFLSIQHTAEDCFKNRTDSRITATLTLSLKDEVKVSHHINKFFTRLLTIMGFAQGGELFYPVEEIYNNSNIERTFYCNTKPTLQFMPAIQHKEDLSKLVCKVIEKQGLEDDKWTEIVKCINFILSAPNYSKARLLLNLITIEKLVDLFGDKQGKGGLLSRMNSYLKKKRISLADITDDDMCKLATNRNSLVHEADFNRGKLGEKELSHIFAQSHELLTRIIFDILDFSGQYCSYTSKTGTRIFPDCNEVDGKDMKSSVYFMNLIKWKHVITGGLDPDIYRFSSIEDNFVTETTHKPAKCNS